MGDEMMNFSYLLWQSGSQQFLEDKGFYLADHNKLLQFFF